MKWTTILFSTLGFIFLVFSSSAEAEVPDDFQGDSLACKMVGAAVGVASVNPVTHGLKKTTAKMADAAAAVGGGELLGKKCEDAAERIVRHYRNWEIDYDDYIERECGGDPLGCSDPLLNPMGRHGTPEDCSTFIVCTGNYFPPDGQFSVNDLTEMVDTVGLGVNLGYWVAMPKPPSPDPGFDPR